MVFNILIIMVVSSRYISEIKEWSICWTRRYPLNLPIKTYKFYCLCVSPYFSVHGYLPSAMYIYLMMK